MEMTRKEFLRLMAAGFGTLAAEYLLGACAPPPPALAPFPTAAPTAIATVPPTLTPFPGRPSVIQMYPEGPSRVVHTRHAGVWSDDTLEPNALRQMLEASITKLTGLNDSKAAWAALFKPNERIAIKVNAFGVSGLWTHAPLVMAVTECLHEAGIPGQQIIVYDHFTHELDEAGYTVNKEGPEVRCYGSDDDHSSGWQVLGTDISLSNILLGCDALINMPVLKVHSSAGLTFALKNHFGSVSRPTDLHMDLNRTLGSKMAALDALPPIRERTRLIIGDALAVAIRQRNASRAWEPDVIGDSIVMGLDPVALDTVGLQILNQLRAEKGADIGGTAPVVAYTLPPAAEAGLGTDQMDNIDLVKVSLG